jgi:hypothetical protein
MLCDLAVPRFSHALIQLGKQRHRYVYSFAWRFRAVSCKAVRIKLLRRPGRANDYAAVPVQGVNPRLCLPLSGSGLSTTDDFALHF